MFSDLHDKIFTIYDIYYCLYIIRYYKNLRRSSLEIKTVLLRNEQERTSKSYHCLVSTASDFVTTEFGSTFTDLEMAFVREILNMLVGSKQIGLTEIRESASEVNLPGAKASYVIDKLIDERWLVRNEKGIHNFVPLPLCFKLNFFVLILYT